MRIIARLNVGGPARHVAWLGLGLDSSRWEQKLVTGRVEANEEDMGPQLQAQGLEYEEIPGLGRSLHPLKDLWVLARLVLIMMRFKPHIVETHTAKAGAVGRAAAWMYGKIAWLMRWPRPKTIHTFHGHTFHGYFSPAWSRFFLSLERALALWATWSIVVLSPAQQREIHQEYGVGRDEQFVLLPLGIGLAQFAELEEGRREFRAGLGVGDHEFVAGAVGRVAPVKNYPLLARMAAELKKKRPELYSRLRLALIGKGATRDLEELRSLARELKVDERLSLLGNLDDPPSFYPGLDALVLTSNNEGTPMVILEAGACCLPVAATRVGGVPDLLGKIVDTMPESFELREWGLTAEPGDASALADALAWIMDNPEQARDLGRRLRAQVHMHHDLARLLDDVEELYLEAVAG